MACRSIGATVLWTSKLKDTMEFYKTLGLSLEKEEHESGPLHYACELGDIHFAIFESGEGKAQEKNNGGATLIGFVVDDVESTFKNLIATGAKAIWEPRDMPWGRSAVVNDPDGRSVEFFTRK